jgi:hypothetical protein
MVRSLGPEFSRLINSISDNILLNIDNLLDTCFLFVDSLPYFSLLKMEAVCSSETSVNFYSTTRGYIKYVGYIT